jgi:hypothetical protein
MEEKPSLVTIPLDVDKLRNLTKETFSVQEEVLNLFFLNVSECLKVMEKAADENVWLQAVRELQTLANCIGAEQISKTCSLAQAIPLYSEQNKLKVFSRLQDNLQILQVFIRNTRY